MKATVPLDQLRQVVAVTSRGAATRGGALPILSSLRIVVDDGMLVATGSNIDLTIIASCKVADGATDGACAIPADRLARVLGTLKGDTVTLTYEHPEVTLTAGRKIVDLRCPAVDQYPSVGNVDDTAAIPLDPATWEAVARVAVAASEDNQRPLLTGVRFEDEAIVATDSFRLHVHSAPAGLDALIPARAVKEAHRLGGQVAMLTTDNEAVFVTDQATIVTRLIATGDDNEYPKWSTLLPPTAAYTATVTVPDRDDLLDAVATVQSVQDSDVSPVRLIIVAHSGALGVAQAGVDVGSAADEVDADIDGPDVTIGCNARTFTDAVNAVCPEGGEVVIRYDSPVKPLRLEGAGLVAITMPVKIAVT